MKIKQKCVSFLPKKRALLILMRTFIFLCFTTVFSFTPSTIISQNIKIDKNELLTVDQVFDLIMTQTDYEFLYQEGIFENYPKVKVKKGLISANELLSKSLSNGNFEISVKEDNTVIVKPGKGKRIVQLNIISGSIKDESGQPLPGANIIEKGTLNGVQSNFDGEFSISVADDKAILVISYVGFQTQEVAIEGMSDFNIVLKEDSNELEEVVIVGYGTQKKVNLTGAVEQVGSEVFENRTTSNTTQALEGVVPNLNISLEDGKPTRTASFNVRGRTSIGQGGSALVLIDGVAGDPSLLNPNDIESVSVLKDAASAAIYGARGAFGVVLITTKKPQKGRTTVNYTGNYSMRSLAQKPEYVTDAVTWMEYFRESFVNRRGVVPTSIGGDQAYSDEYLERLREWKALGGGPKTEILDNGDFEYYGNYDWQSLLFKDEMFSQDHNLSISGGNEKSDFYISGRLYDFDGIYNYNPDVYQSYNLRAKGSLQAYNWLKISNNMEYANNFYHQPLSPNTNDANIQRRIAVSANPTTPIYNPDGTYTYAGANTLGAFIDGNNYQDETRNLFRNTASFNTKFFNNTFRVNGDFTFRYNATDRFLKKVKVPYYSNANASSPSYIGDMNGYIKEFMGHTMYTASNLYTEYENTFADIHYVKAMAGWNYETSAYKSNSIERNQLLLENAESVQLATGESIIPGASVSNWRTAGTFFRLNYGFSDRYLLELNGRYDGSSKFPTNQQWGFFPSVSAGWRLSEEPFWNVNENIVSDIKFRGSYGSLGNGNISPYEFLELLSVGTSGRVLDGALEKKTSVPSPIPDGLTWEVATTTNIGVDLRLLKGKLNLNGDYYVRKTTDMYVAGPTLPDVFGATSPKGNYADMTTKGFEITATWKDQFNIGNKPFNYQVRGSVYDYVSTVDKFNNPTKNFNNYYEGRTIGEIWGFKTDGLFQEAPDPSEYINTVFRPANNATWQPGDLKIVNLDGSADNMITQGEETVDNPGDMTIIGNSAPRYQYNINLSADWNGFFFSVLLNGVGKQDWYPGNETSFWGQYNRPYNQIPEWHIGNIWSEDNPDGYLPKYSMYNTQLGWGSTYVPNDRYLQKVSYIRLKNLQVGYELPQKWISKIAMQKARIYFTGENLASWSPLYKVAKNFMDVASATSGTDSDISSSFNQGDGNGYPQLKSISFGISITY